MIIFFCGVVVVFGFCDEFFLKLVSFKEMIATAAVVVSKKFSHTYIYIYIYVRLCGRRSSMHYFIHKQAQTRFVLG